jgi:subtilisin family serine protease
MATIVGQDNSNSPAGRTPIALNKEVGQDGFEKDDWGLSDIGATGVWNIVERDKIKLPGVVVGVIDVGFYDHEDLSFLHPTSGMAIDDHGNHVAGILCAKHNGLGVRGVLPDCLVVARSGDFLPIASEGVDEDQFMLVFSQILMAMDKFVTERDEVAVFNASLGYNWKDNFDLNPSDSQNGNLRAAVQNQGVFLFPVLTEAAKRGVLIFSAAGNDSSVNEQHHAEWASPFNWASKAACESVGVCSGVVIEAHDKYGQRAEFSNVGGDLSCPGVDIVSLVATDANKNPSQNNYGRMSGTSMASPYCAGGFVLFSLLRSNYDASAALQCLKASASLSSTGAPRLNLLAALEQCN